MCITDIIPEEADAFQAPTALAILTNHDLACQNLDIDTRNVTLVHSLVNLRSKLYCGSGRSDFQEVIGLASFVNH